VTFSTITPDDWRRSIAAARAAENVAWRQIKDGVFADAMKKVGEQRAELLKQLSRGDVQAEQVRASKTQVNAPRDSISL
jgi:hypothetical protein